LDIKQKAKKLFATAAICAITSSTANAQAVKVSSNDDVYFNGNVGIGKTTPAYKLDVYGNARFGSNSCSVILGTYTSICTGTFTHGEIYPAVYGNYDLLLGTPSSWARATFSEDIYYNNHWQYSRPTANISSLCYRRVLIDVNKLPLRETQGTLVVRGDASGSGGVTDGVYIFRPNGKIDPPNSMGYVDNAFFSQTAGRTTFSDATNPHGFTASNDYINICIKNIQENSNGTLSFEVQFCDYYITTYSNTSNLPDTTTTCGSIHTSGTVIVKNTDNIIFESGNGVILNAGFEIQSGGIFEIHINKDIMNCCED
jgi:hypothetical protein